MNKNSKFDLLSTVEQGGCSAKIPAKELDGLLSSIPLLKDANVMVDIDTHDDAGVYRLNDLTALIVTTDFFPPVCSDAYEFGEIAATNSLSDIYAMGGKPLLSLNLNMFPSKTLPLTVLRDIIAGGQSKVNEAGAFTMGGHTIEDTTPKYGLAVVGTVHPDELIANSGAKPGDVLILTKPLGVGVMIAAHRLEMAEGEDYLMALEQMKLLNKYGAELMLKHKVKCATDVTGFGLLGHALGMAKASNVTLEIDSNALPTINNTLELLDEGCIPGTIFRNLEFVNNDTHFDENLALPQKFITCDAQTSGGLLISIASENAQNLLNDLLECGKHPFSAIVGRVIEKEETYLKVK
ncbi:MAG: selenide, water dikinase SelD [Rikenellaceae bacterium]